MILETSLRAYQLSNALCLIKRRQREQHSTKPTQFCSTETTNAIGVRLSFMISRPPENPAGTNPSSCKRDVSGGNTDNESLRDAALPTKSLPKPSAPKPKAPSKML